jgi:hypothetical protein
MIPVWLFDLAADLVTGEALLEILERWDAELDVDAPGSLDEVARVVGERIDHAPAVALRAGAIRSRADAEHERVWMGGCECDTPTPSKVPGRCGRCIGRIGVPPLPKREPERRRRAYEDVVAEFETWPLVPGETVEDRARRAGGEEAAAAFAEWEAHKRPQ